jgi:hypothetical protein
VCFRLKWHRNTVSVSVSHAFAAFVLSGPEGIPEVIVVNGREVALQPGEEVTVELLPVRQ